MSVAGVLSTTKVEPLSLTPTQEFPDPLLLKGRDRHTSIRPDARGLGLNPVASKPEVGQERS
jgi:hypothetical protein